MPTQDTLAAISNATGDIQEVAPATFIAIETALGNITYTPTQNFSLAYNGMVLSFNAGIPFVADPGLQAALLAASAPIQ